MRLSGSLSQKKLFIFLLGLGPTFALGGGGGPTAAMGRGSKRGPAQHQLFIKTLITITIIVIIIIVNNDIIINCILS